MKNVKGITLIALVITIVVLIILAGVAISLSIGENGIFNKAKYASESYANEQGREETEIAKLTNEIDEKINSSTRLDKSNEVNLLKKSGIKQGDAIKLNDSIRNYKRLKIVFGVHMTSGTDLLWNSSEIYVEDIVCATDENKEKTCCVLWTGSSPESCRILHLKFNSEDEINIHGIHEKGWSGVTNYEIRIYGYN